MDAVQIFQCYGLMVYCPQRYHEEFIKESINVKRPFMQPVQGNYLEPVQGNYLEPAQGNYLEPVQGNYLEPVHFSSDCNCSMQLFMYSTSSQH